MLTAVPPAFMASDEIVFSWAPMLPDGDVAPCASASPANGARHCQPPVSKYESTPLATETTLMHITPKTNCTAQAVGEPSTRPLTIARHRTIAQNTQAAPNV